jgi:hypothetical protein
MPQWGKKQATSPRGSGLVSECAVTRSESAGQFLQNVGSHSVIPLLRYLVNQALWRFAQLYGCRLCVLGGYHAAVSPRRKRMYTIPPISATPRHIAGPILVVLVVEWLVWLFLTNFLPNLQRCPICKSSFRWSEIDTYDERGHRRPRPLSFPCPKCLQTIGVPNWRKSFLRISYFALIATFMFLAFDLPGDLFLGFVGGIVAAAGAIRIADWFIRRRLEPGSPPEPDNPSLWT